MNSEEIRHAIVIAPPVRGLRVGLANILCWLREIAYQLAVANERESSNNAQLVDEFLGVRDTLTRPADAVVGKTYEDLVDELADLVDELAVVDEREASRNAQLLDEFLGVGDTLPRPVGKTSLDVIDEFKDLVDKFRGLKIKFSGKPKLKTGTNQPKNRKRGGRRSRGVSGKLEGK